MSTLAPKCVQCIRSNIEVATRDFFEGKVSEVEITPTTESPCRDYRCIVGGRRYVPRDGDEYEDYYDDDHDEYDDDEPYASYRVRHRGNARGPSYKHVSKTRTHEFSHEFKCVCGEEIYMQLLFELTVHDCPHSAVVIREHRDILIRGRHAFKDITTTLYERRHTGEDYAARLLFTLGMVAAEPAPVKRFSTNRLFDRNVLGIIRDFITDDNKAHVHVPLNSRPDHYRTEHATRILGIKFE